MLKSFLASGLCLLMVLTPSWVYGEAVVLGLHVGQASIADVLKKLGPAEGAYLAGSNTDEGPQAGDSVVLRFVQDYQLVDHHSSEMLAFFDPGTSRLTAFVVRFEEAVPSEEVTERFGERFQEIRQNLILFPGGEEGSLEPCNGPSGRFVSWVFEDRGLQVEIDDAGAAAALRFTPVLSVREAFPPCDGPSRTTPPAFERERSPR